MAITVDVNGVPIQYPQTGDTGWGGNATKFAEEVASVLGKIGQSQAPVNDDIIVSPGNLSVTSGNLSVGGNASVTGNTTLTGNITVNGNSNLGNGTSDTTAITGILNVDSGVLYVDPVNNRVGINDTTPSQALDVTGNALISGTLGVTGATSLSSTLGVTGDVAINTNKFNVTASSGNTTIAGTLGISNGTESNPSLTPSGDTNTGLYSIGSDKIGFTANGSRVGEFGSGYGGFTGNVIQIISTVKSDTFSSSSTSFTDITGLSVDITPKYTNSKIYIIINIGSCGINTSATSLFRITRNGTAVGVSDVASNRTQGSFKIVFVLDGNHATSGSISFLDSPISTSLLTYQVQIKAQSSSTAYINRTATDSDGTDAYQGRTISSITVMELQQ